MNTPRRIAGWSGAGLVVMWSSGFVGAELGTRTAPATTLLTWRFLIVGVLAAAWLAWRPRRLRLRDVVVHFVVGALAQVGYLYGVVAAAEHGVSAGVSALIAALQPIVAAVVAAAALGEAATRHAVVGLLLGLAGTAIVVSADYSGSADAPAWAYTLPLSAMLCLTAATTLERRVYRRRAAPPTADALAIQCLAAAALFAVPAAGAGALTPPQSTQFWIAVAWVVVLSTFGGYGFYWIVAARSGIVGVSTLLYLTPAATAAWAWAMFGQPVTLLSAAGAAVCAAGVALVLKRGRPGEFATSLPEVEKPPAAAGPADEPWGHAIRRQRQEQQCPIDSNPKSSS